MKLLGTKICLTKTIIAVTVLVISSFFLFYNLGHYALWDDEATTALFGQSVWRTGDTSAVLDHNLIAYQNGVELKDLHNRYIPPLGFYLSAPFVGLSEESAFAARFPFALCGLLTILTMLIWLCHSDASVETWLLISAGILGNISLMLFSRQCRYYAPAILTTTILAFLYYYHDHCKRTFLVISVFALLLLAANYLCYAAVLTCLTLDYFIWGRKNNPIRNTEFAIIFGPQLILGGGLIYKFNPFGKENILGHSSVSWIINKVALFFSTMSDLNICELGIGIFILTSPFVYLYSRNYLLRCFTAIFTYLFVIGILSPPLSNIGTTVRYLAPLIPLCILTTVLSIQTITLRLKWLAVPLALLAFGTNVLHGGSLVGIDKNTNFSRVIANGHFRSTVIEFTKELFTPAPSAYLETADWIDKNLREKESIWVLPNHAAYPLMFHAPKAIYAWQLQEATGQFKDLPDIHFIGKTPPDYVIVFGPVLYRVRDMFRELEGRNIHYEQVAQINRYWYDLIRPELFWHSFQEIKNYSLTDEAIYIFKKF